MTLGLGMKHLGCRTYQVCSNDDCKLTVNCLTSMSNLFPNILIGNYLKSWFLILLKPKSLSYLIC